MIDYLAIGHVSQDVMPGSQPRRYTPGGTVTFAGRTAQVCGRRAAVLTSAASDFDLAAALPGVAVVCAPSPATTTFENRYTAAGRQQWLEAAAAELSADSLPPAWRDARLIHLAPLVREIPLSLAQALPHDAWLGLTPQGFLRTWDARGRVFPVVWQEAALLLPRVQAVVFSQEDLPDTDCLTSWRAWSPTLVMTQGALGCTVFMGGAAYPIPAPSVVECNPTGAGDIFAAVFFIHYQASGDALQAAEQANQAAARSVTVDSLTEKMAVLGRWLLTSALV